VYYACKWVVQTSCWQRVIYSVSEKNSFDDKITISHPIKQNLQEIMPSDLSITMQNLVKKLWNINGVIYCRIRKLKITISNVVSENGNLMTAIISIGFSCDFTHWLMCTRLTFLAENKFLDWFKVFCCAHHTICLAALPPLHWVCDLDCSVCDNSSQTKSSFC